MEDFAPAGPTRHVTGRINDRCNGAHPKHHGIDIGSFGNESGIDIVATRAGTIAHAGSISGYGETIIVTHANGWSSLYGHLSGYTRRSGTVWQGEHVGEMGSTGTSSDNHLHFEIRRNGTRVDFSAATSCGATITTGRRVEATFAGLAPSGGTYEAVVNGGGTRLTGPNSYLDVFSTGRVHAWNSGYFGGSPVTTGRFIDARTTPRQLRLLAAHLCRPDLRIRQGLVTPPGVPTGPTCPLNHR
jgi:murein DD-endopeptidase MepM/ murein hydrolase activator NlpD